MSLKSYGCPFEGNLHLEVEMMNSCCKQLCNELTLGALLGSQGNLNDFFSLVRFSFTIDDKMLDLVSKFGTFRPIPKMCWSGLAKRQLSVDSFDDLCFLVDFAMNSRRALS